MKAEDSIFNQKLEATVVAKATGEPGRGDAACYTNHAELAPDVISQYEADEFDIDNLPTVCPSRELSGPAAAS